MFLMPSTMSPLRPNSYGIDDDDDDDDESSRQIAGEKAKRNFSRGALWAVGVRSS